MKQPFVGMDVLFRPLPAEEPDPGDPNVHVAGKVTLVAHTSTGWVVHLVAFPDGEGVHNLAGIPYTDHDTGQPGTCFRNKNFT